MRRLVATVAMAAFLPVAVHAGNITPPRMEPEVVVEEAAASSGAGLIVPLMAAAIIIAVASSSGGGLAPPSDIRLKTDVTRVGTAANGLPLYNYRYKAGSTVYRGVMAQDVLSLRPDAVVRHPSGFLAVDYAKLGLRLEVVH